MTTPEHQLKDHLIEKLRGLKYEYREDIRDRAALEKNFREKFESLNHVRLTDTEFARLLDEIITPYVFTVAKTVRSISAFTRDDGTALNYTLVNIKDWCKTASPASTPHRRAYPNARRPQDPQERADAAAFSLPGFE